MNTVVRSAIAAPLAFIALFVVGVSAPQAHEHTYQACYDTTCKPFNDAIEQGTCHGSGEGGCSQMGIALLACDLRCKREAGLCKASIKVVNRSDRWIRTKRAGVYDIQAKKWRHENIRDKAIAPGRSYTERANLPGIKNKRFKINLHYKKAKRPRSMKFGLKTWKSPIKTKPQCTNGSTIEIRIN